MKKLLLSVFAIAAMASCMQDETISQNQQAIDFGTPFVDKATKAEDLTYSGKTALTEFKVYGTVQGTGAGIVNIFNNATVSGTVGAGSEWTCDVKQYWIPGANYEFAAVVDAATVGQDPATLMPTTLVPAMNGEYLKDLLYDEATAVGHESNNEKVAIVFEHLLSKAHFTVTSNTVDGYYHKVTDIKIKNFTTGTYTIDGGTWSTPTETDKAYELGNIAEITSTTGAQTNATQVLLYPTTTDFTVEFTVELRNKNGVDAGGNKVDALLSQVHYTSAASVASGTKKDPITVSTDLLKGNAYNFQLELSVGEEIKFTVSKKPEWATPTNDEDVNL